MKYLKCAGVALASNAAAAGLMAIKLDNSPFIDGLIVTSLFSTLPAIIATGIDKLVNQNISSNKYFQYGATALEAGLMSIGVSSCLVDLDSGKYLETFKELAQNLVELKTSKDSIETKVFVLGAMIQGIGFKSFLEVEVEADDAHPEITGHIKPFFPNMDDHLSNMYSDL
jgi:hypothetical protein